jgi:hypothetical protein
MDQIIGRLQHLKLTNGITQQNNSQAERVPITTEQLSNICLQLYNENIALKKEIQLLLISQNSSVSIPEWVK